MSAEVISMKDFNKGVGEHCDNCGEPAMIKEYGMLRCPSCWLREQGQQIKPIDRGGYRP